MHGGGYGGGSNEQISQAPGGYGRAPRTPNPGENQSQKRQDTTQSPGKHEAPPWEHTLPHMRPPPPPGQPSFSDTSDLANRMSNTFGLEEQFPTETYPHSDAGATPYNQPAVQQEQWMCAQGAPLGFNTFAQCGPLPPLAYQAHRGQQLRHAPPLPLGQPPVIPTQPQMAPRVAAGTTIVFDPNYIMTSVQAMVMMSGVTLSAELTEHILPTAGGRGPYKIAVSKELSDLLLGAEEIDLIKSDGDGGESTFTIHRPGAQNEEQARERERRRRDRRDAEDTEGKAKKLLLTH